MGCGRRKEDRGFAAVRGRIDLAMTLEQSKKSGAAAAEYFHERAIYMYNEEGLGGRFEVCRVPSVSPPQTFRSCASEGRGDSVNGGRGGQDLRDLPTNPRSEQHVVD